MIKHYNLPNQLISQAKDDEVKLLSQLEELRAEIRQHQIDALGNEKFRLVAVGHSLGGLYTRFALGLLHKARFFHPEDGPLIPFVGNLISKDKILVKSQITNEKVL